MGVKTEGRREADKARRVKARRAGGRSQYPIFTLGIPTWVVREVSKTEDIDVAVEVMRGYEFKVELTEAGILYKPVQLEEIEGW
jgi:hypothetical protein